MAKARSRLAARKIKDKWKAKAWYEVEAPVNFGHAKIAETLADEPEKLVGRVAETTLQELTGDFKQMHVKLSFKIDKVEGNTAKTVFFGHSLTSDYVRRMTRRNHSKIDSVIDAITKDGAKIRVKPLAVGDRRTKTTQEAALRAIMVKEVTEAAAGATLNRFVRDVVDGKVSAQVYKACKTVYPLRRVEINKTLVTRGPQVEIEEDWSEPEPEPEPEQDGGDADAELAAEADQADAEADVDVANDDAEDAPEATAEDVDTTSEADESPTPDVDDEPVEEEEAKVAAEATD